LLVDWFKTHAFTIGEKQFTIIWEMCQVIRDPNINYHNILHIVGKDNNIVELQMKKYTCQILMVIFKKMST
jgi:hypothetical protein